MEKELWKGQPSQWINFAYYLCCAVLTPVFGIGLFLAIWKYIETKNNVFTVTDQRIIEKKGVLTMRTDEMELYRVKDISYVQPFFLRMVGLSTILLDTTDKSNPILKLKGIANAVELKEKIRIAVDLRRDAKGVREIDI